MHARRRTRATVIALALSVSLVIGLVPGLPGMATAATTKAVPAAAAGKPGPVTTSSGEAAKGTLSAGLQKVAAKGGSQKIDVLVVTARGAKAPKGLERPLKVRLRALDRQDAWAGRVTANALSKLAAVKGVEFVADNGRKTPPPSPEPRGRSAKATAVAMKANGARIAEAGRAGVTRAWAKGFGKDGRRIPGYKTPRAPLGADPAQAIKELLGLAAPAGSPSGSGGHATGWWDVRLDHLSSAAWAKGHTGKGVRVAVVDEGVDFAHPDLQSTQATVPATVTEYAGWPMAFDPFSALMFAYDQNYGTTFVRDGNTWYSSTVATVSSGAAVTFDGNTYDTRLGAGLASKSGVYHIGYQWDANLVGVVTGYPHPAVLVSDANTAGVYDTVIVDLSFNRVFADDKPCTKGPGEAPISYLDYWDSAANAPGSDGYADISGGMIYWISDGHTGPPGYGPAFGSMPTTPGAGTMIAFMGALDYQADHGTLCASNVGAQGVIDGASFTGGTVYPSFKHTAEGMVLGGGKDAGLVAIGDMYKNFTTSALMSWDFTAYGPDGIADSGDEVQVVSNSFGTSDAYNDEWDLMSRYLVALNRGCDAPGAEFYRPAVPHTTFLVSTGNGAPGYATVTPPRPTTGIGVGASTQYGSTGDVDSIVATSQITWGDVSPFSNRGPSAMGHGGTDVVADGSLATGDVPLNMVGDGWRAWESWAGTSRSCPVTAGNLTLAYQAYKNAHGNWPSYAEARAFLMNGAIDSNYDTFVQGAGRVNAERTSDLAAGTSGVSVDPPSWSPGGYRGTNYPAYASLMSAGETTSTTLTLTNNSSSATSVTVSSAMYARTRTETFTVTLDPSQEASGYDFSSPDYVRNVTSSIATDTDLTVFRVTVPLSEYCPDGTIGASGDFNAIRVLTYDWTDVNHDGRLLASGASSGVVTTIGPSGATAIEPGEYMRFAYANNDGPTTEVRTQRPTQRMHDGLWFGLQHSKKVGNIVHVTVEMSTWKRTPHTNLSVVTGMPLTIPAKSSAPVVVNATAPAATGLYEGQFRIQTDATTTVVPVSINVAESGPTFDFGGGGDTVSSLMPNSAVLGYQDWGWRPESGDGRFFMTDVASGTALPTGAKWVVHTSWDTTPTDIDTFLFGPSETFFHEDPAFSAYAGPNDLEPTGGSAYRNLGAGLWAFQTATGGPDEWVAGDLKTGLNAIFLHNIISDGLSVATTFTGEAGVMSIDPQADAQVTRSTAGTIPIDLTTGIAMTAFNGRGWGMTPVYDRIQTVAQDATWYHEFTVADCGYIDATSFNDASDLDMYLEHWDTSTSAWIRVGASEGPTGDENIRAVKPVDGRYRVGVYGYDVAGGTDSFRIRIADPQGPGLGVSVTPSGTVPAHTSMAARAAWSVPRATFDQRDAVYEGIAGFGPGAADQLLTTTADIAYPFEVYASQPASGGAWSSTSPVTVELTRRADPSTVTSATAYITAAGETDPIPGAVAYNDASGTITITAPLVKDTRYAIHVTADILAVDGTPLTPAVIPFTTAKVVRIDGLSRYETAAKASESTFPTGAATVVIASGQTFPDALSASGLCGAVNGPLLLTTAKALPAATAAEIDRLGATDAYIVGGTGAVSSAVYEALVHRGLRVRRVSGADRYATAVAVATRMRELLGPTATQRALLATGKQYPDALTASALAVSQKVPVLFTSPSSLTAITADGMRDLGVSNVWIFGGTGAVTGSVANSVKSITGHTPTRWGGLNRYDTAGIAAEGAADAGWIGWTYVGLATGKNYPDGLAGGVATGWRKGPLLLTEPDSVPAELESILTDHKAAIRQVTIFGGPGAVSDGVQTAIEILLN